MRRRLQLYYGSLPFRIARSSMACKPDDEESVFEGVPFEQNKRHRRRIHEVCAFYPPRWHYSIHQMIHPLIEEREQKHEWKLMN